MTLSARGALPGFDASRQSARGATRMRTCAWPQPIQPGCSPGAPTPLLLPRAAAQPTWMCVCAHRGTPRAVTNACARPGRATSGAHASAPPCLHHPLLGKPISMMPHPCVRCLHVTEPLPRPRPRTHQTTAAAPRAAARRSRRDGCAPLVVMHGSSRMGELHLNNTRARWQQCGWAGQRRRRQRQG